MNNEENNFDNLPDVVTVDALKEGYGADAARLYHEIALTGGFGDLRENNYIGGCPPLALRDLSDEIKGRIAQILVQKKTENQPTFGSSTIADKNNDEEENN